MKSSIGTEIVVYHESAQALVDVHKALVDAAKGDYQRMLATGHTRWSGADLAGKAAKYAAHYAQSREAYLARVQAEFSAKYERVKHGRKILVITCPY